MGYDLCDGGGNVLLSIRVGRYMEVPMEQRKAVDPWIM